MNAYFAVGTLVSVVHKHNRLLREGLMSEELGSPMVVVELLHASLWGLGANESYRCLCKDGRLRIFHCHELVHTPNAEFECTM